jgi:photosystem II stability/assembly factor-like uncharacterized protein
LIGGIGLAVLLAVAWGVFRFGSPLMSALSATPTAAPTGTAMPSVPTATSTATSMPGPTPTAILLSWGRLNSGQLFQRDRITAIAIDPNDPGVIYVGTQHAGIYKSIDGGLSWYPTHHGLANARVTSLLINPQNPQVLYVGTLEGIYKTEDGAENWSQIGTGIYLLIDPQNSSHLYARDEDGIYESTDQGRNWREVYATKESCPGRIRSWATHPTEGDTLFITVEQGEACEQGLYLSNDGGNTWKPEEIGNFCLDGLVIGLDGQGKYYKNTTCGSEYSYFMPTGSSDSIYSYWDSDSHLYKENLNQEQRLILGKPDIGFVTAMAISPEDPDTLYAAGEGIAVSGDGGLTWTKLNNGLGSGKLQLDASSGDIPILYVQSGECDGFYDPEEGWDNRQALYISTDHGSVWDFASDTGCSLIKDADGSTLYRLGIRDVPGGESYGWIWRSRDAGRSWEKIITPERVISLSADTTRSGLVNIYVLQQATQARQQYVSEDYGHTWKMKEPPADLKLCYGSTLQFIDQHRHMAMDPRDGNHVFFIDNGALLESHNSCETTSAFGTAPNTSMNSIAFDHNNPGTLYAGTDEGAYISFDSGGTWSQINEGLLGATVVFSIVVDPESNVYAATPYGIFKLEGE